MTDFLPSTPEYSHQGLKRTSEAFDRDDQRAGQDHFFRRDRQPKTESKLIGKYKKLLLLVNMGTLHR
jgi:hypothetical protein